MPKYEIMVIVDPKKEITVAQELATKVFGKVDFKKMERTDLAYEINKSKKAHFALINVDTQGENINEFTRVCNIEKAIWRIMPINLDKETTELKHNLRPYRKPAFTKKPGFQKRNYNNRNGEAGDSKGYQARSNESGDNKGHQRKNTDWNKDKSSARTSNFKPKSVTTEKKEVK